MDKVFIPESELNYTLITLGSGSELLDYLRCCGKYAGAGRPQPDLILLDLYMPELSGLDLLRSIVGN